MGRGPGSFAPRGLASGRPSPLLQTPPAGRPEVRGKFLYVEDTKLYVRGVTYGTFRPREGVRYPPRAMVGHDLDAMTANGINAIRTYTVPPRWLLDAAHDRGLRVMVGLPWTQHVAFLERRSLRRQIVTAVRDGVRRCAGHPALLCFAIGNEIPAPIVRWHGRHRVQDFLERLYRTAKAEDPGALVTYVNYPTTEYLELPFLDLVTFNVYLEERPDLEEYLARLHNLADDRPLVMAEVGLDSLRNGEAAQAESLRWQLRTIFGAGSAGAFVFSWTDEWHRGGHEVEDWDFGLTTRDRIPKPALEAVREAYAAAPYAKRPEVPLPRISVVLCTYNGRSTIGETLRRLKEVEYPDFEVIVVNDGSTDETLEEIRRHDVTCISMENRGLSAARNIGLEAATGEIVAYLDDDAYPDPHWLRYLAEAFRDGDYVGVGGPNIVPPDDPLVAQCVANAPGGPVHVLISDREAEHIPGCNMAFQKEALEAVGGFDARYRAAGDDVDLCWRLQEAGGTLGFHPGAMVWHHRRASLRKYWAQQVGYGKAEALLEEKWPEKYNSMGHLTWQGRLYGNGTTRHLGILRARVYHGTWGSAPFQSLYERGTGTWLSLPLMPEWWLLVLLLAGVALLGMFWQPLLFWGMPLLVAALVAPAVQAALSAIRARPARGCRGLRGVAFRSVTAFLHLAQPVARLWGRLKHGLTPWRKRGVEGWLPPLPRRRAIWSETWHPPEEWLRKVDEQLREAGAAVLTGGTFDRWDLSVRGGILGGARLLSAVEEHGEGKQYVRFRITPRFRVRGVLAVAASLALAAAAAEAGAWIPAAVISVMTAWIGGLMVWECGAAVSALRQAVERVRRKTTT